MRMMFSTNFEHNGRVSIQRNFSAVRDIATEICTDTTFESEEIAELIVKEVEMLFASSELYLFS